jgi:hypothetical protein
MRKPGRYVGTVLVVMMLLLSSAAIPRATADEGTIVGTWIVTTTADLLPGAPPLVFTEFAAFNVGGTFTDTHAVAHASENPFLPPLLAVDTSDAYGTWRRVEGPHRVALTFKRLVFAGPNTSVAAWGPFVPGQHIGFETVQTVLTLGGRHHDTFAGPFTVQLSNLAGQLLFAASGTVAAKRLEVEPLATP